MKMNSILIVEDEAIIAMGIQSTLESLGYRVAGIAYRGEDALEKAAKFHPDLVLMDVTLRGPMNGIETANQIRLKFDLPVIYLSAMTDQETILSAEQTEPYGYITKPVSDEMLGITIYYALSKYNLVKQLRDSEAQYRELFETSLDGIVITDLQGIIIQGNPAFADLVGVDPVLLPGKSVAAFSPPEFLSEESKWARQVLESGYSGIFEKEYIHSSGRRIPVNLRMWVRKGPLGEPIGYWAIIRDLSALQATEKARKKSELVLQALIFQNPNGIALFDSDGQVLAWNYALEEMTGLTAIDTIGKSIGEALYAITSPELQDSSLLTALKEEIQQGLSAGTAPWMNHPQEYLIHKVGGEVGFLENYVFPVQILNETQFAVVSRDITTRKLTEDKILRQSLLTSKLVDATQRLNNEFELARLSDVICEDLTQIVKIGAVGVSLFDPTDQMLKMISMNGRPPQSPMQYSLSHHQEFIKHEQTVEVIPDVGQRADGPVVKMIRNQDIRTLVIVNLTHKERLIGAIYLGSQGKTRQFDEDERAFLATYGHHVASAMDRARLFEESRQRTRELEILSRLSAHLRLAASPKEMLPILLEEAFAFTQAVVGAIYVIGRGNHILEFYQTDPPAPALETWFHPDEPLWKAALADDTNIIHSEIVAEHPGRVASRSTLEGSRSTLEGSRHEVPWKGSTLEGQHPGRVTESEPSKDGLYEKVVIVLRSNQYVTGLLAVGFTKPFRMDEGVKRVALAFADIAGNALQRSGLMETLEQQVTDRTRELSTLYELTLLSNTPRNLEQLLEASLEKVLTASGAHAAVMFKYEQALSRLTLMAQVALPEDMLPYVNAIELSREMKSWLEQSAAPRLSFTGSEDPINLLPGSAGFSTRIYVPVHDEKMSLGLLCILWQNEKDISAENISLIRAVAERLGSAIQNRTLRQQAEQAAVLEERQRLARELHDSVTQSIYSMTLLSEAGLDIAAQGEPEKLISCLRELQQSSIHALREMRLLLFELRSPQDKGLNLMEALRRRLESVERRSGIRVEVRFEGVLSLPTHTQEELYRVANEALNNSLKHSGTKVVSIELQSSADQFEMRIEDQGCGFDPRGEDQGGIGVQSMRERVQRLGGEFSISSDPGKGTRVITRLKIQGENYA
jgi:PAS domain S-box-containing protein